MIIKSPFIVVSLIGDNVCYKEILVISPTLVLKYICFLNGIIFFIVPPIIINIWKKEIVMHYFNLIDLLILLRIDKVEFFKELSKILGSSFIAAIHFSPIVLVFFKNSRLTNNLG